MFLPLLALQSAWLEQPLFAPTNVLASHVSDILLARKAMKKEGAAPKGMKAMKAAMKAMKAAEG